jgi:hypothetical protein
LLQAQEAGARSINAIFRTGQQVIHEQLQGSYFFAITTKFRRKPGEAEFSSLILNIPDPSFATVTIPYHHLQDRPGRHVRQPHDCGNARHSHAQEQRPAPHQLLSPREYQMFSSFNAFSTHLDMPRTMANGRSL